MRKLILLGCLSYFVIGLAHVVAGAVLEPVMTQYELDYSSAGQWITNQFIGFLVGVLVAPLLSSRIGRRVTLVFAMGALTVAEAVYSILPPWNMILLVAPVAGIGFGMTEAVVGALIMDVYQKGKASAMGWLEVSFGVGALAMPGLAAFLIKGGIWQMSFPVLTALAGVCLLLWMTLSFGPAEEAVAYAPRRKGAKTGETAAVGPHPEPALRYPRSAWPLLILGMAFFFLYVGMEMVLANYLPSVLTAQSGLKEAEGSAVLSLFWAAMVAGRLLIGVGTRRSGYGRYLLISVSASLVSLGLMSVTYGLSWMLILIGLSGFGMAGIFAVSLIYVNERLPGMTDRTTSLMVACGGVGGALFPKLGGWIMDTYDWHRLLQLTAAMAAGLFILLLALLALRGKNEGDRKAASE